MKALVTGATGFIGSHLVELLLRKKYDVRVLLRRTSDTAYIKGLPVEYVYGDLFDPVALKNAVSGMDFVYHSAGVTKAKTEEEYIRGNAEGTRNILSAVKLHAAGLKRFIHVSSQTAVGPSPGKTPVTEDIVARPITTYGKSKWMAEQECREAASSVQVTIVRPPAVYGPRDKDVLEFFRTMGKGLQPMVGLKEKYVSLIHVTDLVRGFVLAGESGKSAGQTYFITSRRMYGWKEVGEVTRLVLGKQALRLKIPEFGVYVIATFAEMFGLFSKRPVLLNYEKARDIVQDYWTCDGGKAEKDFEFVQELSLEEGIRNTVGWYKANGWM